MNKNELTPEQSARFEWLLHRYADDDLSTEEMKELNAGLRDWAEIRLLYIENCCQSLHIHDLLLTGSHEVESPSVETIVRKLHSRSRITARQAMFRFGIALALCLVLYLGFWQRPQPVLVSPLLETVAIVTMLNGSVAVIGENQNERIVQVGDSLLPGQRLTTFGDESSAELRFPDGSRVLLGHGTSATYRFNGRVKVELHEGELTANVESGPSPMPPMQVQTDDASIETITSSLAVERRYDSTAVYVPRGEAKLTRRTDQQVVSIHEGETARIATDVRQFSPRPLLEAPDTFHQSFAKSLPPRWECGELINGAVRAMPHQTQNFSVKPPFHQVRSQHEWTHGLFAIHNDSWLSVRFRVDKPGFFHLLVLVRSMTPDKPGTVFRAPDFWQNRKAGVWYTVHVPFRNFRGTISGKTLESPKIATTMIFDSQEVDRGLTIERYWVTRGTKEPSNDPPAEHRKED